MIVVDHSPRYEAEGRAAIDALAAQVQDTGPGMSGSTSPFVGRDLGRGVDQAIGEAVAAWRRDGGLEQERG